MINRNSLAVLAAFLLATATASAADAPPPPWTLDAALAEALARSPDARLAEQRVAAAQAMLTQASSADWPQLSLKGSYMQTNNAMMAFGSILGQRAFSPAINFNSPGQVDNLNLTAAVGYNIYSGGRATAGKAAARAGAEAAALDREAALAQLQTEVARAYFQIQQSQEALRAIETAVASYEEVLRVSKLRYDSGQMLKSELLNIEVQLAQTREQSLIMRNNLALAGKYFLFLLGHDSAENAGTVTLAPASPASRIVAPPENLTVADRPELQAMRRRVTAAENAVRAARGALRPTVNAFGAYQYDKGWRLNGDSTSWAAGIQAEVPIFDGKLSRGRVREAEAEQAQAQESLRKLELALALQLDQARLASALAREQLAVTETLVAQADESARISRERFAAGSLLSAELIGVETRLTEARMRRAVAQSAEKIATLELRRAAGLPLLSN